MFETRKQTEKYRAEFDFIPKHCQHGSDGSNRLLLNQADMFDCGLDLLGHEILNSLYEDDSHESEDDEGNDGCPRESVGPCIGVMAGVKGCAEDAGADTWDGCEGNGVTRCHALHESWNGGCWETGLDGSRRYLGNKSLA